MLYLIPILSAHVSPIADAEYKVVSVDRHEAFAGKLGRRVEQTLTVERDGQRYEIRLSRSHTAIRGSVKNLAAGDMLKLGSLDWGTQVKKLD
jgi:hypothetical protein